MKRLITATIMGIALTGCTSGPKQNEPLGFKIGMTTDDVRKIVNLTDYEQTNNGRINYAKSGKIEADPVQPEYNYLYTFHGEKLNMITASYKGKENVQKAEEYLNKVANCEKTDSAEGQLRRYTCYEYGARKGDYSHILAEFSEFTSSMTGETSATIQYVYQKVNPQYKN